jgi:uncharacterized membrane protein YjjP (DUF1212 family)
MPEPSDPGRPSEASSTGSGGIYHWRDQLRVTLRALEPDDTQPMPRISPEPLPTPPDLLELLRALGVALLNSADSAATATQTLQDVAAVYQVDLQAMVMPTGILLRSSRSEVDLVTVPNRDLRLDQIGQVNDLVALLKTGTISPAAGLERLDRILTAEPRFPVWVSVVGQMVLAVGFGLLLNPDLVGLPFYAGLGLFVALLRLLAGRWGTPSVALPVIAAFLVTVLAVEVVAPFVRDDPIRLVVPGLITFLPGATLTIATIELAGAQIVSGASRLVWGMSQLLLLAFGVFAGLNLIGYPEHSGAVQAGAWAPWVGVALVGVGYMLYSSAPPGALIFLLIALYGSYAAQTAGALLLTPSLSGLLGGLVIVPLSHLLSKFPHSPPGAVLLLPAFWLLLPGALGFRGVSSLAMGETSGVQDLIITGISIFAVAFGVLVGMSITKDAGAIRRTWRLRVLRRRSERQRRRVRFSGRGPESGRSG